MSITAEVLRGAEATKAIFFVQTDAGLQAVEPKEGDWFCEYDWDVDYEGDDFLSAGAMVEYAGLSESVTFEGGKAVSRPSHRVVPEGDDCDREPSTLVLVRQH